MGVELKYHVSDLWVCSVQHRQIVLEYIFNEHFNLYYKKNNHFTFYFWVAGLTNKTRR